MKRLLLIWNLVPDTLRIYCLELEEGEFNRVKALHGQYAGVAGGMHDDDYEWISSLLSTQSPIYDDGDGEIPEIPWYGYDAIVVAGAV